MSQRIAYDVKLKRPGCALLQAAYGCPTSVLRDFPAGSWLLYPTDDLHVYEATNEELAKLVTITRESCANED